MKALLSLDQNGFPKSPQDLAVGALFPPTLTLPLEGEGEGGVIAGEYLFPMIRFLDASFHPASAEYTSLFGKIPGPDHLVMNLTIVDRDRPPEAASILFRSPGAESPKPPRKSSGPARRGKDFRFGTSCATRCLRESGGTGRPLFGPFPWQSI